MTRHRIARIHDVEALDTVIHNVHHYAGHHDATFLIFALVFAVIALLPAFSNHSH
jgi:hypothetical protein